MKKLTKKQFNQIQEAARKCDYEGGILGGYTDYGIDYEVVEMLGFGEKEVIAAVNLLISLEYNLGRFGDGE